ncbi:hypothetical protein [Clostridium sp.]
MRKKLTILLISLSMSVLLSGCILRAVNNSSQEPLKSSKTITEVVNLPREEPPKSSNTIIGTLVTKKSFLENNKIRATNFIKEIKKLGLKTDIDLDSDINVENKNYVGSTGSITGTVSIGDLELGSDTSVSSYFDTITLDKNDGKIYVINEPAILLFMQYDKTKTYSAKTCQPIADLIASFAGNNKITAEEISSKITSIGSKTLVTVGDSSLDNSYIDILNKGNQLEIAMFGNVTSIKKIE